VSGLASFITKIVTNTPIIDYNIQHFIKSPNCTPLHGIDPYLLKKDRREATDVIIYADYTIKNSQCSELSVRLGSTR
jgi:hypothetical protein